jgi:hypothetical protein
MRYVLTGSGKGRLIYRGNRHCSYWGIGFSLLLVRLNYCLVILLARDQWVGIFCWLSAVNIVIDFPVKQCHGRLRLFHNHQLSGTTLAHIQVLAQITCLISCKLGMVDLHSFDRWQIFIILGVVLLRFEFDCPHITVCRPHLLCSFCGLNRNSTCCVTYSFGLIWLRFNCGTYDIWLLLCFICSVQVYDFRFADHWE